MGIALFTAASLLAPVQKLLRAGMAATARRFAPAAATTVHSFHPPLVTRAIGPWPVQACATAAARDAVRRPLRVVRVVDGLQGTRGTGRMVISGRMADVCAELDRLVACEGRSA
jgi:hypothetical protein